MSSMALSRSVAVSGSDSAESRSLNWKRIAGVGAGAAVASGLAVFATYFLGDVFVRYDSEFVPLQGAVGIGIFTAVLAIPAVLVYALLLRRAANPARAYTLVSAVALLLSFIPDFTMLSSEAGVSNAQVAVLCSMHVVAAAVIVPMLVKFAPLRDA
jgi:hypothetical protein